MPYSIDSQTGSISICLVSSRKHRNRFVLPKGGIEVGESSRQAAIREMWEEAGLRPMISNKTSESTSSEAILPNTINDDKAHGKSIGKDPAEDGFVPRATYEAHEIQVQKGDVESEIQDWPEKKERIRKWTSVSEAVDLIEWRKDIHTLLLRSSLLQKPS